MKGSRTFASVLVAATIGAGGTALATSGTYPDLKTTGASFTSISWSFDPWPCNSSCHNGTISGFNYHGNLHDTAADGDAPFIHAKTDGYDYGPRVYNHNGNGTYVHVDYKVWDPNGDPAQSAVLQVCRDRGTLFPDNCATSSRIYR